MVALAFVLALLLAIWLAVKLGGVRRRDPDADKQVTRGRASRDAAADRADSGVWIGSESDLPTGGDLPGSDDITAGGGRFGGGGASGDWSEPGDSGGSSGDGGGGD
jgi:uncharacterized membrane protein YgcG